MMTENLRETKGKAIAQSANQVNRIDDYLYTVKSQSKNGEYAVTKLMTNGYAIAQTTLTDIFHANTSMQ